MISRFRIGQSLLFFVACVFLYAAIIKFSALDDFLISLDSWSLVPENLHPVVSVLVPATELSAALFFLLNLSKRNAAYLMSILLIAFSITYASHLITTEIPDCNCMGKILAFNSERDEALFVLIRNGIMLLMVIAGLVLTKTTPNPASPTPHQQDTTQGQRATLTRAGFTLIETLATIALIAILVSLLLPSLSSVRDLSKNTRATSDLRQHATIVSLYTDDWDGNLPFFADPFATQTVVRTSQVTVAFQYFSSHIFWPYPLMDTYYRGVTIGDDVFRSPFLDDTTVFDTAYYYTCSAIASPAYWDENSRSGMTQLKPNKLSSVRYPSAKGLMSIDPWLFVWQTNTIVTAENNAQFKTMIADMSGAVHSIPVGKLQETVNTGDGGTTAELGGHRLGAYPSAMHTRHGILGRDLP